MTPKKSRKITFTFNPLFVQVIISIIGIIMVIISEYPFKSTYEWWSSYGKEILNSLGCTVVAAGGVSIMLELSTIQNYINNSQKEILFCNFPIERYQISDLLKLKDKIALHIISQHHYESSLSDTLYKYECNLLNLTKKNYFDYHHSTIIITPNSASKTFHKKVTIEYKIINNESSSFGGTFKCKIVPPYHNMTKEQIKNKFIINSVKICGKNMDIQDCKNKYLSVEELSSNTYSLYKYEITIQFPNIQCEEYDLSLSIEYDIPINDITSIQKMTQPCKQLLHTFHISPDSESKESWKINANAFTAFYCKQEQPNANYSVVQDIPSSLRISFKDWALPGAGYEVIAQKDTIDT